MEPAAVMLIMGALAAAKGAADAHAQGSANKQNAALTREQMDFEATQNALDRGQRSALATQGVAQTESLQDPFRDLVHQGQDLSYFDRLANWTPTKVQTPQGFDDRFRPHLSGGYTPSDRLRGDANSLYAATAGGMTAPSMTNSNNWGKTGVLNLLMAAAGKGWGPNQGGDGGYVPPYATPFAPGGPISPYNGLPSIGAASVPLSVDEIEARRLAQRHGDQGQ